MSGTKTNWTFTYASDEKNERKHSNANEHHSKNTVVIRRETAADQQSVFDVNAAAFSSEAEPRIVNALRDAGLMTFSLVAELGERIVGNVVFSPLTIEFNNENLKVVGLAPLAVHPEFQKEGFGSALVYRGIEICREEGYDVIVVLGSNYYSRFGFVPAETVNIFPGDDGVSPSHFQALLLHDRSPSGPLRVKYAAQFFTI